MALFEREACIINVYFFMVKALISKRSLYRKCHNVYFFKPLVIKIYFLILNQMAAFEKDVCILKFYYFYDKGLWFNKWLYMNNKSA